MEPGNGDCGPDPASGPELESEGDTEEGIIRRGPEVGLATSPGEEGDASQGLQLFVVAHFKAFTVAFWWMRGLLAPWNTTSVGGPALQ